MLARSVGSTATSRLQRGIARTGRMTTALGRSRLCHIERHKRPLSGRVTLKNDDLSPGRLRWTDLTPRDWLDLDEQEWVPLIKLSEGLQPFEKECFRKDGSRAPVLVGAATFKESGQQGVALVLDLIERKRAEARDSERRYREVQMSLAVLSLPSTVSFPFSRRSPTRKDAPAHWG
jgi:hypothetical protein